MQTRRSFLEKMALTTSAVGLFPLTNHAFAGSEVAAPLRVGLIGVGLRGTNHLENMLLREDVAVTALCDTDPERLRLCMGLLEKAGKKKALTFGEHPQSYRDLLALKSVDAVVISTPWSWHTPMAVDAMKAGKYTGLEVSAATTLEECWDLVNTHEASGTHLMLLENVNYRRDIMAVLRMVREGVFGELIHFRCGYQHDLREVKFNNGQQPYGGGVEFGENATSEAK